MKEQNKQTNEKIDSIQESLIKQLNVKIETVHGNIKQTMNEQYHELKETINRQREYMNTKFEESNKNIKQIHEKIDMISNTLSQKADTYKGETNKQMDEGFKRLYATLDSTSEGIKVSPNTEESMKEIEIREYQGVIVLENKNSHNKEDNQYLENKTKKIRKTCRKKIINTREAVSYTHLDVYKRQVYRVTNKKP